MGMADTATTMGDFTDADEMVGKVIAHACERVNDDHGSEVISKVDIQRDRNIEGYRIRVTSNLEGGPYTSVMAIEDIGSDDSIATMAIDITKALREWAVELPKPQQNSNDTDVEYID